MNVPPLQKCDYIVKVALLGGKGVGKTNILTRLCYGEYSGVYKETVGIDFFVKSVTLAEKKLKLQFWDVEVSSKSQSQKIRNLCCRGIIGLVVVYSISDASSFQYAQRLLNSEIKKEEMGNDVLKILVANKIDQSDEMKINREVGEKLAESNGMVFLETSAKDSKGIKQLDLRIGTQLLNIIKKIEWS